MRTHEKNRVRPQSLLLLLLFIVFVQLAYAKAPAKVCLPFTIVFGNGVGNTRDEARTNRMILSDLVGSEYKGRDINYDMAFNPTEGPGLSTLLDVIEAARQKADENNTLWSLTWRVIFGVVDEAEPNQSWVDTIAKIWLDFNAKVVGGMRYNLVNKPTYYDDTVAEHVELYKKLLTNEEDPQRVLLVAHSQGNLYGNIALQIVEKDMRAMPGGEGAEFANSLAMVGVGSAADYVYKDGPYLTSYYDNVINTVRALYPTVLPGNVTMPALAQYRTTDVNGESVSIADYTGHGFATVYTNSEYAGRELLKNHIKKQLDVLTFNSPRIFTMLEHVDGGPEPDPWNPKYWLSHRTSLTCVLNPDPGCGIGYDLEAKEIRSTVVYDLPGSAYNAIGSPSMRWPEEKMEVYGKWLVNGNAKEAFEQIVVPRLFNPDNPAYIGVQKEHTFIGFHTEVDPYPYIWIQRGRYSDDYRLWEYHWVLPQTTTIAVRCI